MPSGVKAPRWGSGSQPLSTVPDYEAQASAFQQQLNDVLANSAKNQVDWSFLGGYGSSGGGGGAQQPNYFDPGPYLPPLYTGPSQDEINAQWAQFGLGREGIDLANTKNLQDYQNALAALGLSRGSAEQQAGYQTGKLKQGAEYQRGSLGIGLDKQLADLLSNASASGAVTSQGYNRDVGFANRQNELDRGNIYSNLTGDLGNVAAQLQNALSGNTLQQTQAGQGYQQGLAENQRQLGIIGAQEQGYNAGNQSQVNQYGQNVGKYNTQYNYTPYGQTRIAGDPLQQALSTNTVSQAYIPPPVSFTPPMQSFSQSGGMRPPMTYGNPPPGQMAL